jgi:PIN domain nuclease of toxin-antitoxin system
MSAGSAWEIATKTRLGRLDAEPLLSAWAVIMADLAAIELPIDAQDAIAAGALRWDHCDPFDRLLVAQATRRNLTIATRDAPVTCATPRDC